MPRGNANIDCRDRPVIVVATDRGVRQLALKSLTRLHQVDLIGAFGSLTTIYDALQGVRKARAGDRFLVALEGLLELEHRVYLYEPEEAVRLFQFDIGEAPRDGAVYVQHPIFPDSYISPDQYGQRLAREKEAAFRQLASSLGAKEVRLVSAELKESRGWFGARLSLKAAATQAGVQASFSESGKVVSAVYAQFGSPKEPPRVPADLQRWVDMEADFRTMANQRIQGNLLHARVAIEFREAMGSGGSVAAKLAGQGFSVGGSYERMQYSIWFYEVDYWPKD
jgi:hypothetical protein